MQTVLQADVTKTAPFNGAALDVSALEPDASVVVRVHVNKLTPETQALIQLQHCPDTTAEVPVWTAAAAWQISGQVQELQARTIHTRDLQLTAQTIFGQTHGAIRLSLVAIAQDGEAPSIDYAAWLE
jgi:hypothetical protein